MKPFRFFALLLVAGFSACGNDTHQAPVVSTAHSPATHIAGAGGAAPVAALASTSLSPVGTTTQREEQPMLAVTNTTQPQESPSLAVTNTTVPPVRSPGLDTRRLGDENRPEWRAGSPVASAHVDDFDDRGKERLITPNPREVHAH